MPSVRLVEIATGHVANRGQVVPIDDIHSYVAQKVKEQNYTIAGLHSMVTLENTYVKLGLLQSLMVFIT